jgi:N-acetyl-alpha-D-muramate 1-phosphate uridylyltransferase
MKAMILAAGKGERMLPLTANKPKPLLEVDGKSLIQHQIEKLAANGFEEIVINYSYLGEMIEQALGTGNELGVNIQYSPEAEPLETAGGIIQALPLLGNEPFVLVNGDIWTDYSFKELPVLKGDDCLAHLVMVANADHHPEGDYVLGNNGLLSFPDASQTPCFTYSGISAFHPDFFTGLGEGRRSLPSLFVPAMHAKKISGEYYQGEWIDVGTPERLQSLQAKRV